MRVLLLLLPLLGLAAGPFSLPPALVDIKPLKKESLELSWDFSSELAPIKTASIRAKASAKLLEINAKNGEEVQSGQVLFTLDSSKAKANLKLAEADLKLAKLSEKAAKRELERAKSLKSAISEQNLKQLEDASSKAAALVQKSEAALGLARLSLDDYFIKAPFSGHLSDISIHEGEELQIGSLLANIKDKSELEASFYLPDTLFLSLSKDFHAPKLRPFLLVNGKEIEGQIKEISSELKLAKIKLLASFPGEGLMPGLFAPLKLKGFLAKDVFKIPLSALQQDLKGHYIYLKKDQSAEKLHISPFYINEQFALVKELREGDLLILNNFKKIALSSVVLTDEEATRATKDQSSKKP